MWARTARRRSSEVGAGLDRQQVGRHDLADLGEAVDVLARASVTMPTGRAVLDHDDRAVRPLGDQRQRLADGRVGLSVIGVS